MNGANIGVDQDEYNANGGAFKEYNLGPLTVPVAGNYTFKFNATGRNARSSGYIAVGGMKLATVSTRFLATHPPGTLNASGAALHGTRRIR